MSIDEALRMAEAWTHDLEKDNEEYPLFLMVRALLDHIGQQRKDIDDLTHACRVLLKENRSIRDALR